MFGYRKGLSAEQALLSLIEKLKNTPDQNEYGSAMEIFWKLFWYY